MSILILPSRRITQPQGAALASSGHAVYYTTYTGASA